MLLDTRKKNLTVWVVKVPKYLGDSILSLSKKAVLGKMLVQRATDTEPPRVEIRLSETLLSSGVPRAHITEINDQEKGVYVVDAPLLCGKEGPIEVIGRVNKECIIRPVVNEEYLKFKQERAMAEREGASATRIIDYFSEIRRGEKFGSLRDLEALAKRRKMQLQAKKRERLDSADVYNMIFRAFEMREQWSVKDLADFTGQPVAYIQELIQEVGVLNKRDHRNAYELKPEYRHTE